MANWKSLNRTQKAAAEQVFDALTTLDALSAKDETTAEAKGVGFTELYSFATDPASVMDDNLRRALNDNERLRNDMDQILDKTALYHFPLVAAASSGAVDERDGEGFKIRLRQSRAERSQTYVMIELDETNMARPSTLFVRSAENDYGKYPLPEAQGGVIQLLVESGSDLVKALRDVHTEVFIR
ncbi:MAG: hypothetical protein HN377_11210 [Alphaproteobacteria bacterium]|jgi:hypothetical protein|nr:hypothetical protein [Alphaproteobacteria bacterium]